MLGRCSTMSYTPASVQMFVYSIVAVVFMHFFEIGKRQSKIPWTSYKHTSAIQEGGDLVVWSSQKASLLINWA